MTANAMALERGAVQQAAAPTSFPAYVPGLDGMRAVSVLLVITGHAGFTAVPGALGVTVFFFLSGFLITNLLISEAAAGGINVPAFYARRYLRLMPEVAVYVIVGLLAGLAVGAMSGAINTIAALFYFTNYVKIFGLGKDALPFVTGHFWSLAVEEHFYLTWPLVMALVPSPKKLLATTTAVIAACLAWRLVVVTSTQLPPHYVYYASETRFDSIAFGCLCALLFRFFPGCVERLARRENLLLAAGLVLLAIPFGWRSVLGLNETFQEAGRYTVQGFGFILCFVYIYAKRKAWVLDMLEASPLRFIGRASYGMYVWHFAAIYSFMLLAGYTHPEQMPTSLKIGCAVFAVLASAILGWAGARYVLRPFARLRRQFGSHRAA